MFTGIVEDKGTVIRLEYYGQGRRLSIELPPGLTEIDLGDSINVNGACLTVVEKRGRRITVDVSSETLERTILGELREGQQVHLERALRFGDRLGGHLVTGHIDGIGVITGADKTGDFVHLRIQIPKPIMRYVVEKGSIAIDGVSLTVNQCLGDAIALTLIPFTLEKTTLLEKRLGDRVNVEVDILGKYVETLLGRGERKTEKVDQAFLEEHGFLRNK